MNKWLLWVLGAVLLVFGLGCAVGETQDGVFTFDESVVVSGHTRTVVLSSPVLFVQELGVSTDTNNVIDLAQYLGPDAVAIIARIEFKDSVSAGNDVAATLKMNTTYELTNLANIGHFKNNTWNGESGIVKLDGTEVTWSIYASGNGTASCRMYLLGYIQQVN